MPSLTELSAEYPEDWAAVEQDLSVAFDRGKKEDIRTLLDRTAEIGNAQKTAAGRNKNGHSKSKITASHYIRTE